MKAERSFDVVIIGGGHAGAQAALMLRHNGFDGSVAIVSAEPEAPYERPPLSKEYLAGIKPFERLYLQPQSGWIEKRVELILETSAVEIESEKHLVTCADGQRFAFGKLVWAAGGTPRRLPCAGSDLASVHNVRDRADVDRLIQELPNVDRVAVIGGGYIGLEAAAVLSKLGKQIILMEALDRVLGRVAGEPLSRFYEAEHREQGVDVRLSSGIESILNERGRARGIRLTDGSEVSAEMIIVGIGITPNCEALRNAGAETENGVRVSEYCQTSLDDIYAVGDCAEHQNIYAGGEFVRIESVQNANDQATTAAKHICGVLEPYRSVPWFWSNQYDLKLQTVGLSLGYDDLLIRGDPGRRSFSVIYLKSGRVIALDCVNAVRDYVQGRILVTSAREFDRSLLADPDTPLKSLLN